MPGIISLAEAQVWLGDSSAETAAIVAGLIDAASEMVAEFLNWNPVSQTRTGYFNGHNTPSLMVPEKPVTAVTAAQIIPALTRDFTRWGITPSAEGSLQPTVLDPSLLTFDGRRIFFTNSQVFPLGNRNIMLTYTAGYDATAMPRRFKQACQMTVAALWQAQKVDPNVSGESFSGVMSKQFLPTGAGNIPPAARSMLMGDVLKASFA